MRRSRSARIKEKRRKKVNKKWITLTSLTGLLFTYNIAYATPDLPTLIEGFYENEKSDAFEKVNETVILDLIKYEDTFKAEVEKNTVGFEESITVFTDVEKKAYIRSLQEYAGQLLAQIESASEEERSKIMMQLDRIFESAELEMRTAMENYKQQKLAALAVPMAVGGVSEDLNIEDQAKKSEEAIIVLPVEELEDIEKSDDDSKGSDISNKETEIDEPLQSTPEVSSDSNSTPASGTDEVEKGEVEEEITAEENQQDEKESSQIPLEESTEGTENTETDAETEVEPIPDSVEVEVETGERSPETIGEEDLEAIELENNDALETTEIEEGSDDEPAEASETEGNVEDGAVESSETVGSSDEGSTEPSESEMEENTEDGDTDATESSDVGDSSEGASTEQSADDSTSETVTE